MKEKSLLILLWVLLPVVGFSQTVAANINAKRTPVALPMELYYLRADAVGEQVMLEWASIAENKHDYFTVERSQEGSLWETVTIVDGTKNSEGLLYYMSIDEKPLAGRSFYRVKQTDIKNQFTYSKIMEVNVQETLTTASMFPFTNTIIVQSDASENGEIRVYTKVGQDNMPLNTSKDDNGVRIDPVDIPTELYSAKTKNSTKKVYK